MSQTPQVLIYPCWNLESRPCPHKEQADPEITAHSKRFIYRRKLMILLQTEAVTDDLC